MAPRFVMMVGLAGSGKSTVAKRLATENGAHIISSDSIRKELYGDETIQGDSKLVFQLMDERCLATLAQGTSVIYDATNVSVRFREQILEKIPPEVEKECVWVKTSVDVALERNLKRDRQVPEWVIIRQASRLQPPTWEEGWNQIRVV